MNLSTDVTSGEIKVGKKNKKMLTISDIPFSVANSQSAYCFSLSWSELVFFQKSIFPVQTLFTINVFHTLTVAVCNLIFKQVKHPVL